MKIYIFILTMLLCISCSKQEKKAVYKKKVHTQQKEKVKKNIQKENKKEIISLFDRENKAGKQLVALIIKNIYPDSWHQENKSISHVSTQLLAVTTAKIHKQIRLFLDDIRKLNKEQAIKKLDAKIKKRSQKKTTVPSTKKTLKLIKQISKQEKRLKNILEKEKATWSFEETPLQEVITSICLEHDIDIVIDTKALQEPQIQDAKITLEVQNIKLKTGLKIIVQYHNLISYFKNNKLYITTKNKRPKDYVIAVLYDVRDLIQKSKEFSGPNIR